MDFTENNLFTGSNTFSCDFAILDASLYAQPGENSRKTTHIFKCSDAGNHAGEEHNVLFIESRPVGSGANGPGNADYGASISVAKQNFLTTSVQGEIDGLNIAVRQGGGANSDCAGILMNVATAGASGFAAATESLTSILSTVDGSPVKQVDCQTGVLNDVDGNYIGFHTNALLGSLGNAFDARQSGGTWSNFICCYDTSGKSIFKVNSSGNIILTAPSGSAPKKTIRSMSGRLSVLNDSGSVEIFSLTDTGCLTLPGTLTLYDPASPNYPTKTLRVNNGQLSVLSNGGEEILTLNESGLLTTKSNVNCGGVSVNGVPVISTRKAGWSTSTGTARRDSYNANGYAFTASATYSQSQIQNLTDGLTLALQQIKAIKDDLIGHHTLLGA